MRIPCFITGEGRKCAAEFLRLLEYRDSTLQDGRKLCHSARRLANNKVRGVHAEVVPSTHLLARFDESAISTREPTRPWDGTIPFLRIRLRELHKVRKR